jgi:sterol desaturase/sphingolipid hydroxylase (fatty acid hydroxylase superfamily)
VNFGISTTIWDRLFGTFQPTNEPATDYVFWSNDQIVLDEADLQAERDELREAYPRTSCCSTLARLMR